jgi:hypothetical protein
MYSNTSITIDTKYDFVLGAGVQLTLAAPKVILKPVIDGSKTSLGQGVRPWLNFSPCTSVTYTGRETGVSMRWAALPSTTTLAARRMDGTNVIGKQDNTCGNGVIPTVTFVSLSHTGPTLLTESPLIVNFANNGVNPSVSVAYSLSSFAATLINVT